MLYLDMPIDDAETLGISPYEELLYGVNYN